jgi:hypothetical protein
MSSTLSTDQVIEALRPVEDPELRRSIVDLGMVRTVGIDGGRVSPSGGPHRRRLPAAQRDPAASPPPSARSPVSATWRSTSP